MAILRGDLELSAESMLAPEIDPVLGAGVALGRGADGVVSMPAEGLGGDPMQLGQLASGTRPIETPVDSDQLHRQEAPIVGDTGADRLRDPNRTGGGEGGQTLRLGLEHLQALGRVELDEVALAVAVEHHRGVDAAAARCAFAAHAKGSPGGGADLGGDRLPGAHVRG